MARRRRRARTAWLYVLYVVREFRWTLLGLALVLAIGRFFGGGMRIAPHADIADGLFDAVTIGDVSRLDRASARLATAKRKRPAARRRA